MSSTTLIPTPEIAFILQVKIYIDPKDVKQFMELFKSVYHLVINEEENAYFVLGESIEEPGVFQWTEGWKKDVTWFMSVQMKKEYYEEYLRITEPMFIKPREVGIFKPAGGRGHIKLDLKALRV